MHKPLRVQQGRPRQGGCRAVRKEWSLTTLPQAWRRPYWCVVGSCYVLLTSSSALIASPQFVCQVGKGKIWAFSKLYMFWVT